MHLTTTTRACVSKHDREQAYSTLTSIIGDMELHKCTMEGCTCNHAEYDEQIRTLFLAKEIVRDWVDPCNIPF